jgi:hypothetical protein
MNKPPTWTQAMLDQNYKLAAEIVAKMESLPIDGKCTCGIPEWYSWGAPCEVHEATEPQEPAP